MLQSPRAEMTLDELEWAEFVHHMMLEGIFEEEAPHPEKCPICRSRMNEDCICDFCGFGEDEELYEALKSAANMREAYSDF